MGGLNAQKHSKYFRTTDTYIPPERYQCLGELMRDAFVQFKSETALIEANRKRENVRYTYLEVKRLSERFARRLQDAGVGAGDHVAIAMSNQSKWLIAASGALFRGAVLVPIDYKLKGHEKAKLLTLCAPKVLVTEYSEWRELKSAGDVTVPLSLVSEVPEGRAGELASKGRVERYEDALEHDVAKPDFVMRRREDQATLVYSSGTGGDPKGCMLSHGNYLDQFKVLAEPFPLGIGDKWFSILPTNHAIDFMCGFIGAFAGGATVIHQRSLRPEFLVDAMKRYGVTHMAVVPLILEAFERRIKDQLEEKGELTQHVFEGLKQINAGLTLKKSRRALSKRLLKPIHDGFGGELKVLFCGGAFTDRNRAQFFYDIGIPVVIGYGLTEAGTALTLNDMKPFRADSVGRALSGVELEIRDPDESGVGSVWVKSSTVFMGYRDNPALTAETIVDGWLNTGDRGFLDPAANLHLVGRSKNMIVTAGGKNIYPEDIESAFEGMDCEEFVVFASDYVYGGGDMTGEQLMIVVREEDDVDRESLIAELTRRNRKLPDFKRVSGLLITSEEFPRTASMKIKRGPLAIELRETTTRADLVEIKA